MEYEEPDSLYLYALKINFMRNKFSTIIILFLSSLLCFNLRAQSPFKFPAEQIHKFNTFALNEISSGKKTVDSLSVSKHNESGLLQMMKFKENLKIPQAFLACKGKSKLIYDTLIVTDTMTITGTWMHEGPIFIVNNGLLKFQDANATILGDIYLMGAHPQLISDSSTLYIPQQYFYQRSLVITGGGRVIYHNTTVDHSGLSHNLVATDSAYLELKNVTQNGFTTNGLYGHPTFNIGRINVAGEYVITDRANLKFRNSNTVLLWHHFPDTAIINFSFPANDTVHNYLFNNTVPGIRGIEYSIDADSCTDVMWGMMPVTGSDVTISNSQIRSIGLWFLGSDTITVNGLVDNSSYSNFTASLSDRNLQLNNCSVMTWSLYPMEHSYINMTGCIVGEIGTMGRSQLSGSNFYCDGSGGYMWTNDTTFMLAGFASASGYVRSQGNGILLFAYSSIVNGYPSALGNSVIMVIQSNVPQEPVALDKACAWYAFISQPFDTYTDRIVPVTGSVWIEKTSISNLMDFGSYRMYYQKNGDADWTEIIADSLNTKHNDTLCIWNTSGLAAGQYNLKLVLRDSWGNTAEAIKEVNVLPAFMGLTENAEYTELNVYPNPSANKVNVKLPEKIENNFSLQLFNSSGEIVLTEKNLIQKDNHLLSIDIKALPAGNYFLKIYNGKKYSGAMIVKM